MVEQKLRVGTITNLEFVKTTVGTRRFFVRAYQSENRVYDLLGLNGPLCGKLLVTREKAIKVINRVESVHPDITTWTLRDMAAFIRHEVLVINTLLGSSGRSDIHWEGYRKHAAYFSARPGLEHLRNVVVYRRIYFSTRLAPTYETTLSHSVRRRLNKKSKLRNSNAFASTNKTITSYVTPSEALERTRVRVVGISTKRVIPLKDKIATPKAVNKLEVGDVLYADTNMGVYFPSSHSAGSVSLSITYSSNRSPSRFKKQKQVFDIPF